MAKRTRAQACSWLAGAIGFNGEPGNPADVTRWVQLGRESTQRRRDLSYIADELGNHVDASVEHAWELIEQYEGDWAPRPERTDVAP